MTRGRCRQQLLIILFLSVMVLPASADYQSDRQWTDSPGVLRLYLGKKPTNRCPRWTVERCIRAQGEPQQWRRVSANEDRLIYYGKKMLYRGTGEANSAVSREWREYVVRGENVVDEFEVVQVLEPGFPWMVPPVVEALCESYGAKNTGRCDSTTPMGPIPEMPPPSKPPGQTPREP